MHIDCPHIESWAAALALKLSYAIKSGTDYDTWRRFRKRLIRIRKKQNKGVLVCYYCNKDNLLRNTWHKTKAEYRILATLDHVHPLAKNGKRYDENNLVVACFPCNQKKADKLEI